VCAGGWLRDPTEASPQPLDLSPQFVPFALRIVALHNNMNMLPDILDGPVTQPADLFVSTRASADSLELIALHVYSVNQLGPLQVAQIVDTSSKGPQPFDLAL